MIMIAFLRNLIYEPSKTILYRDLSGHRILSVKSGKYSVILVPAEKCYLCTESLGSFYVRN